MELRMYTRFPKYRLQLGKLERESSDIVTLEVELGGFCHAIFEPTISCPVHLWYSAPLNKYFFTS